MQRHTPSLPALAAALVLVLVSCGPGQPSYQDRVRPLPAEQAHPALLEVLPLLEKATLTGADALIRTWHDYISDQSIPLRKDNTMTFVYYDFSHLLDKVYLEASFAPGKKELLTRFGNTALFYRTYEVPKPDRVHYRFSDGADPLGDPFNPDIDQGSVLWQPAASSYGPDAQGQWIEGVVEAGLDGQNLRVLVPPSYRKNLAWTYPLVVIVGLEGTSWLRPVGQMMEDNSIQPLVIVAVQPKKNTPWTSADLKATLEDRVIPWIRHKYRVTGDAQELVLIGWGAAAKPAAEIVASRPEFWGKTWFVPEDQTQAVTAWNSLAPPYFRAQYPVETP